MSHTPGPWRLDLNIAGGGSHKDFPELLYINVESTRPWGDPKGLSVTGYMRMDDALLIAAAPELLAIANQYASECADCGGIGRVEADGDPSRVATEPCEACADIRAAIAKATGEQP